MSSGTTRYTVGTPGTARAFTGQEADPLTGLYYYYARWYDPVVGLFLSVDTQEGNVQGANPYSYVRENPETATDPTGLFFTNGTDQSDRAFNLPDGNGGFTQYTFIPKNPVDRSSKWWVRKVHFSKPKKYSPNGTYEADDLTSHQSGEPDHPLHLTPKQVAHEASENFHSIGNILGFIPGSEIISLLENAGSLKFGPKLTGIVGAILSALSYLSSMALAIANGFDFELGQKDNWFTLVNLTGKGSDIISTAGATGFTDDTKLLGTAALGAVIAALPCGICQAIGGALMISGITSAALITIGMNAMLDQVNSYINTQKDLASEG